LSACENSMKDLDQYFHGIDEAFALQGQNSSPKIVEIWRKTTDLHKMFYFLEFMPPFLFIINSTVTLDISLYSQGEISFICIIGVFIYYLEDNVIWFTFITLCIRALFGISIRYILIEISIIIVSFAYIIFMAEAIILGFDQKVFLRPFFSDEYPTSLLYNRSGTRRKFIRIVLLNLYGFICVPSPEAATSTAPMFLYTWKYYLIVFFPFIFIFLCGEFFKIVELDKYFQLSNVYEKLKDHFNIKLMKQEKKSNKKKKKKIFYCETKNNIFL
jgi:hypothetical protein